jgi:hypothetical protein
MGMFELPCAVAAFDIVDGRSVPLGRPTYNPKSPFANAAIPFRD